MPLLNLTRPISTASVAGSLLPWEAPYSTEPIATLEHNGANLFFIEMSPSAATRLVGRRIVDGSATSTRDIDAVVLLNRPAAVVHLPAAAGETIEADALDDALAVAAPRPGDALLLATGWGDARRATEESYVLDAPHLADDAVALLRAQLAELGGNLVLTDLPYLQRAGGSHAREEWVSLVPWLRPAWPSPNAQAYLRHYTPDKVRSDWGVTLGLLEDAWLVLGLVGCVALRSAHPLLTVAPFQVRDVGEVPCTVVATT